MVGVTADGFEPATVTIAKVGTVFLVIVREERVSKLRDEATRGNWDLPYCSWHFIFPIFPVVEDLTRKKDTPSIHRLLALKKYFECNRGAELLQQLGARLWSGLGLNSNSVACKLLLIGSRR